MSLVAHLHHLNASLVLLLQDVVIIKASKWARSIAIFISGGVALSSIVLSLLLRLGTLGDPCPPLGINLLIQFRCLALELTGGILRRENVREISFTSSDLEKFI